jgi:Putative beta-lactamase-inhibitor-like, PepSY-like
VLVLWSLAGADEVKVPLKDVPKAVLDSVKAKFPRAELTDATKESEDGKTTYEIALKDGGRAVDLSATADGTITEIETAIDASTLPAKVTSALEAKYPLATIKKAEEIIEIKDGKETKSFEVIVATTAKKSLEVKVSPEGKILKEEQDDE